MARVKEISPILWSRIAGTGCCRRLAIPEEVLPLVDKPLNKGVVNGIAAAAFCESCLLQQLV